MPKKLLSKMSKYPALRYSNSTINDFIHKQEWESNDSHSCFFFGPPTQAEQPGVTSPRTPLKTCITKKWYNGKRGLSWKELFL